MAAVTAAIITAAATAYAAHEAKSAANDQYQNAKSNTAAARASEQRAIETRRNTPGARATPFLYDMALQVYGKAFGNHGFNLPIGQMFQAMNIGNLESRALNDKTPQWQGTNPIAQTGFSAADKKYSDDAFTALMQRRQEQLGELRSMGVLGGSGQDNTGLYGTPILANDAYTGVNKGLGMV